MSDLSQFCLDRMSFSVVIIGYPVAVDLFAVDLHGFDSLAESLRIINP